MFISFVLMKIIKAQVIKFFVFFSLALIFVFSSACEKPAGEGGESSIRGRVWVKDFPTMVEYGAADQYVYIIYGDDISYGNRIRTTYDGQFEFKYLRAGKYKIYTYSMSLANPYQDSAVIRETYITKSGQTIDLSNILIYK